jgi:hypothetical protein
MNEPSWQRANDIPWYLKLRLGRDCRFREGRKLVAWE